MQEISKQRYLQRISQNNMDAEANNEKIRALQELESSLIDRIQKQTVNQQRVFQEFQSLFSWPSTEEYNPIVDSLSPFRQFVRPVRPHVHKNRNISVPPKHQDHVDEKRTISEQSSRDRNRRMHKSNPFTANRSQESQDKKQVQKVNQKNTSKIVINPKAELPN